MSATLSRKPTLIAQVIVAARSVSGRCLDPARFLSGRLAGYRQTVLGYCQLLAGAGGRLGLQVVYFFVLANTLSLAAMGVFASVSAAGVLIGCLAGFGFQSFVMRSAAGRRSSLGGYLGAYYVCFAAAIPIMFAVAGLVYLALFSGVIALPAYAAIILVEVVLWRQIELLVQVNNGLGRFGAASTLVSLPVGFRAAAAVAFWAAGGGDAETWSAYYLAGNALAVAVLGLLFHPRVRLRFRLVMLTRNLRGGLLYALSYCLFLAQGEVDKLVILSFGGERMAGIYAISMRLIDLTGVPLRPMFMIYSRKIIQAGRATPALLRECLRIEALVALVSTGLLFGLLAALWLKPDLLGTNVAAAYAMLTLILAVPAVRNLLEFHGELFFAFGNLGWRACVTGSTVALKAGAVALLITAFPQPEAWTLGLNAIYLAIYAMSFFVVYRVMARSAA